jgi:hypothetical protein
LYLLSLAKASLPRLQSLGCSSGSDIATKLDYLSKLSDQKDSIIAKKHAAVENQRGVIEAVETRYDSLVAFTRRVLQGAVSLGSKEASDWLALCSTHEQARSASNKPMPVPRKAFSSPDLMAGKVYSAPPPVPDLPDALFAKPPEIPPLPAATSSANPLSQPYATQKSPAGSPSTLSSRRISQLAQRALPGLSEEPSDPESFQSQPTDSSTPSQPQAQPSQEPKAPPSAVSRKSSLTPRPSLDSGKVSKHVAQLLRQRSSDHVL